MSRHVVRVAGQDLNRASLLVRDEVGGTVVPAGPLETVLGTTVSTARAGQRVSVELPDGTPREVAAGGAIEVGDELMIGPGGTVVQYAPGGKKIGTALTGGQPPGTVTVTGLTTAAATAVIGSIVGSPEGVVVGTEVGQLVLEIDADGVPVNLWRFNGTPGNATGWQAFGSPLS